MAKALKDKVANVRFVTIKLYETVISYVDGSPKEKIKR